MDACFNVVKLIIRVYQRIFPQSYHVSGIQNLPPGAKIIAANHPNATDIAHLPFILKEHFYTIVQGDLFSIPLLGWLLTGSEQIPLFRNQGQVAIQKACFLLAMGKTVLIFPEGRLNPENSLLKGGSGTVRMSLLSGAPIVPMGIYVPECYTCNVSFYDKGLLRQGRWQTGGCCYFRFGSPWVPRQEMTGSYKAPTVGELTDQLMQKIYQLASIAREDSISSFVNGRDDSPLVVSKTEVNSC